jgi:multisubunit Na+/H+ antiporter MnhG subunit
MTAVCDALLTIAAVAVWLGCLGFIRLRDPFDRQHCVTFVGVAAGIPIALAAWITLGNEASVLKIVFLVACAVLNGAALGHATGRAIFVRHKGGTRS